MYQFACGGYASRRNTKIGGALGKDGAEWRLREGEVDGGSGVEFWASLMGRVRVRREVI